MALKLSVFALELCLRMDDDLLRSDLTDLVRKHPSHVSPGQKWKFHEKLRQLVLLQLSQAELGCWDFFDEDDRARRDYDMWCNGMITLEGARAEPSGPVRHEEPRFMTFTVAMQLVQGSPSEQDLAERCAIPERDLWKRSTFARILRAMSAISYASVKSDVVYVIPGDRLWGLTREDLQDPKFAYLRRIES